MLKIKLAMAIIGISSIHLLKTFIEAGNLGTAGAKFTEAGVMWQTIIHVMFILSAVGIAYVDRLGRENSKQAAGGSRPLALRIGIWGLRASSSFQKVTKMDRRAILISIGI